MRTAIHAIFLAGALLLSACGDTASDAPPPALQDPPSSGVMVDRTFLGFAGRWQTPVGSLENEQRLVIDIASNGGFSIDVRKQGVNAEAIVESGKGTARKQGTLISGNIDQGPGIHNLLERYMQWTIYTQTGTISTPGRPDIRIIKE